MHRVALCALAVALATALPAEAQTRPAASAPAPRVEGRAYFIVELESMTASRTFQTFTDSGTNRLTFLGAGYDVTRIWKGVFARVDATYSKIDTSRVYVDDGGNIIPVNVPLTITVTPVDIGGGWRFASGTRNRAVTVVPYVGAAMLLQKYKETSKAADPSENVDKTDVGRTYFAGVEIGISYFKLGLEGLYRDVPNVLGGAGSVSGLFNETNLGGSAFRLTLGVGF